MSNELNEVDKEKLMKMVSSPEIIVGFVVINPKDNTLFHIPLAPMDLSNNLLLRGLLTSIITKDSDKLVAFSDEAWNYFKDKESNKNTQKSAKVVDFNSYRK